MATSAGIKDLGGRAALVTGASRGIGPLIADALASEGMHLVITARRQPELERVAEPLRAHGGKVFPLAADLTAADEVESLARRAIEATGAVDVLVNNAGMAAMLPYERTSPEDLRREVAVNLTAPLVLSRLVLPGMLARRCGHIVNISSLSGEFPLPHEEVYCATKAGLILFGKSLRAEYRGTGVSASVLLPGVISGTGMVSVFEEKSETKFTRSRLAGGCRPEQVARAVVRAIRDDVPEIVVNQPPLRPVLALFRLFPRLVDPVLRRMGVYRPFIDAARVNLAHGGRLTDVTAWPDTERPADHR